MKEGVQSVTSAESEVHGLSKHTRFLMMKEDIEKGIDLMREQPGMADVILVDLLGDFLSYIEGEGDQYYAVLASLLLDA